jgi:ABC-2 type transport system ATP-binding protein
MEPILTVRDLHKHYKKVKAVNGISFSIPPGICFGLLGPNGAGKTTTIEMIEGISQPTSGEIIYKGQQNNPNFKQEAGIQFQATALMDFLTVQEVLDLFYGFYTHRRPINELIEQCDLADFLNRPASKLSGGQRQRLLLAIALINDPEIIFLDEPTTGLDPQSRRNFWGLVERIKEQGKTIILTTHYMDEAEFLCEELVIIDHGKVVTQGSPKQLLDSHFGCSYVYLAKNALTEKQKQLFELEIQRDNLVITTTNIQETLKDLMAMETDISSLMVRNPTLDDLFLKITGHSLRE